MDGRNLRQNAADFIAYKRAIGYVYDSQEYLLNRYMDYAENAFGISACYPLKGVTDDYLSEISDAAGTLYGTVAVLREFSRFLIEKGFLEAYVIPPKTASQPEIGRAHV